MGRPEASHRRWLLVIAPHSAIVADKPGVAAGNTQTYSAPAAQESSVDSGRDDDMAFEVVQRGPQLSKDPGLFLVKPRRTGVRPARNLSPDML